MRIPIFWVGRTTTDGRVCLALEIRDVVMPVTDLATGINVGKIHSLRFEDGGLVTAELETIAMYRTDGKAAQADCDSADIQHGEDDGLVIRSARLRGIHLGDRPVWDGMVIGS